GAQVATCDRRDTRRRCRGRERRERRSRSVRIGSPVRRGVANAIARWFERCTAAGNNQEVFPMSNKNERRKLSLNRETIRTLNGAELGDVNGGTIGAIVTASIRVCRYSDKIVRGAVALGGAVKWAVDNAPKGDPDN